MPLFRYKVSDADGTVSVQQFEGDSQQDAARRIQRRGLIPLEYLGDAQSEGASGRLMQKKFNVVEFTDRLVPLLEANIPLERSLGIIGDDQDNKSMSTVATELRRGLHEGRKLSDLIRERGTLFPQIYAGVVEAGEEAGALPQVMGQLRQFLTSSAELRSFIISSSIYPAFIACSGVAMLGVVLGVIVPKFAKSLAGAGVKSQATEIMVWLSETVHDYWWVSLILIGVVIWIAHQVRKPEGAMRRGWDALVLRIPVLKRLSLYSNLSRFARTMAILMRSGVHLLSTVSIANRVIQNLQIRASLDAVAGELRQGQKISGALGHSRFIPSLMLRMIAVGEETGNVEGMLDRVADRYEEDLRSTIKRLLSLFEPVIIILLGLGIGFVVLLMFMAIMDMQNAV